MMLRRPSASVVLAVALVAVGCGSGGLEDAGPMGLLDGSRTDAAALRDASVDAAGGDSGMVGDVDAGAGPADASTPDASTPDAGGDDSGTGAGVDAGAGDAGFDAGLVDAGFDAGLPDAGPPSGGCISGATGTHVLRFQWAGTTSGSRAFVRYEANTLPDTSRWRVSAASRSIGYTPVFSDPFLGEGGLELSGSTFIDVELSTSMLSRVRNATLAIYGRSFNTTTSGSFTWQTFSDTGAAPRGSVSNVAPYRWYAADATTALPAGDGGTLLRIQAGGPSGALIVSRVEICFDAI